MLFLLTSDLQFHIHKFNSTNQLFGCRWHVCSGMVLEPNAGCVEMFAHLLCMLTSAVCIAR